MKHFLALLALTIMAKVTNLEVTSDTFKKVVKLEILQRNR
jgi:hypothetical protein